MPLYADRYKQRYNYLTKDPNGPRQKRLDVLIPEEDYEMFREIMDATNGRRRDTLQAMIRQRHAEVMAEQVERERKRAKLSDVSKEADKSAQRTDQA